MDANVATLIAGLGGTALGAVIAAAVGWWQARRQRVWQEQDFERAQEAARAAEVRARADAKAAEILAILERINALLNRMPSRSLLFAGDSPVGDELRMELDRLQPMTVYLSVELRQGLQVVLQVIRKVDDLAINRLIDDPPRRVAFEVVGTSYNRIGNFLRGEPVKGLSAMEGVYMKAVQRYNDLYKYAPDPARLAKYFEEHNRKVAKEQADLAVATAEDAQVGNPEARQQD